MRRIAITGHLGRLGSELVAHWGCVPLSLNANVECDICEPDEILNLVDVIRPDVIINCAAITQVDACEDDETLDKAVKTNFWGVEYLAATFPKRIIHISTDYVFDGKNGPYSEKAEYDSPVNSYGWTKWLGEVAITNPHINGNVVVRTTGLYGRSTDHDDFVKGVWNALSNDREFLAAKDLRGNQTYIPHFAEALIYVANNPDKFKGIPILHVASDEIITRYEFALMVATVFGLDKSLVMPCSSKDILGWIAKRPIYGGLKVGLAKKLGVPIYKILDGLKELRGSNDLS